MSAAMAAAPIRVARAALALRRLMSAPNHWTNLAVRQALLRPDGRIAARAAGWRDDRRRAARRGRGIDLRIDVGRAEHAFGAGELVAQVTAGSRAVGGPSLPRS